MKSLVKKVRVSLIVVGVLSVLSSNLQAQEIPLQGAIPFSIYDMNKNGFVSEKEFYDARAKRMSQKADQGRLMRKAANAPDFGVFDTNSDGKLTKVELLEGQNKQMQINRGNRTNKGNRGSKQQGQGRNNR